MSELTTFSQWSAANAEITDPVDQLLAFNKFSKLETKRMGKMSPKADAFADSATAKAMVKKGLLTPAEGEDPLVAFDNLRKSREAAVDPLAGSFQLGSRQIMIDAPGRRLNREAEKGFGRD